MGCFRGHHVVTALSPSVELAASGYRQVRDRVESGRRDLTANTRGLAFSTAFSSEFGDPPQAIRTARGCSAFGAVHFRVAVWQRPPPLWCEPDCEPKPPSGTRATSAGPGFKGDATGRPPILVAMARRNELFRWQPVASSPGAGFAVASPPLRCVPACEPQPLSGARATAEGSSAGEHARVLVSDGEARSLLRAPPACRWPCTYVARNTKDLIAPALCRTCGPPTMRVRSSWQPSTTGDAMSSRCSYTTASFVPLKRLFR